MRIVTVDGRDPDVFKRFSEMKYAVRREELEFPVGLGLEEARVLMTGNHSGLDHPAVLHTFNAPENTPMIAVNEKLGFRPVAQRTTWERTL